MEKVVLLNKLIKIIFIFALVVFLTWKAVGCVKHYFENPTYTTNQYVNQAETDFPAITICTAWPWGYKRDKLKKYGIDVDDYFKYSTCHSNVTWSSIKINISEKDLFDDVTYQFNEFVGKIQIGYFNSIDVSFTKLRKYKQ